MRLPIAIILAVFVASASAAEPGNTRPLFEEVKAVNLQVEWPGAQDREALVIVRFDVLANGKAANIHLVDEGFYEQRFADAAIKAVQEARWQPRRVNGQAVDSLSLRQPVMFNLPNQKQGMTKAFHDEARKVEDLLKKGDYAAGEAHAQWMLSEKVKLKYEYGVLEGELANTYALLGRTEDAVRKIFQATARKGVGMEFLQLHDKPPPNQLSNYVLGNESILQLLELRMRLLATEGLALEAMQSYYELAGLKELPSSHPMVTLAALLTAQIRGPGNLRGKIEIRKEGVRQHALSRRSFTLEKVQGVINSLEIFCRANSRKLDYIPGEEWTVPEGWGVCQASVAGEPGTTFEFVEFPDATAPASSP